MHRWVMQNRENTTTNLSHKFAFQFYHSTLDLHLKRMHLYSLNCYIILDILIISMLKPHLLFHSSILWSCSRKSDFHVRLLLLLLSRFFEEENEEIVSLRIKILFIIYYVSWNFQISSLITFLHYLISHKMNFILLVICLQLFLISKYTLTNIFIDVRYSF